jgi:TonB family protein
MKSTNDITLKSVRDIITTMKTTAQSHLASSYCMKTTIQLLITLCLLTCPILAQETGKKHPFTGRLVDPRGVPIAFGNVYFTRTGERGTTSITDISGKFVIELQPGTYEVEVNKSNSRTFKAFIQITANGPNPADVLFTVDPDDACCRLADGVQYPKPISLPKPPYPPAARAVRASGEVEVELTVEPDGSVSAATARSGHPLLRAAALKAARSAKFEPTVEQAKRNVVLTYVFLADDDSKAAPARYKNSYRIEVVSQAMIH